MYKKFFTLAEVLITLAIVGVVAALVIPTLVTTLNTKIKKSQTEVIEKRLVEGVNLFNTTESGLQKEYGSTYEFLQGLSKHYKMTAICDAAHLNDCYPYAKVNVVNEGETKEVEISSLSTAKKLKLGEGYLAPAAFISAIHCILG